MNEQTRRIPLPKLDTQTIETLLGRDVSATLAFIDRHGFPRIVPCWFLWQAGAFYVSSVATKFHVKCLQQNPKASICVEHEEVRIGERRTNRQVKAVGTIEFVADPRAEWTRAIRRKYLSVSRLGEPAAFTAADGSSEERIILKLEPAKLTAHGGSIERVTD